MNKQNTIYTRTYVISVVRCKRIQIVHGGDCVRVTLEADAGMIDGMWIDRENSWPQYVTCHTTL